MIQLHYIHMSESESPILSRATVRAQFPCLERGLYLNHAAVAPWPQRTCDAVIQFARENAQDGPAAYRNWIQRESDLRQMLATLTGAASEQDIALLKNTTEGISMVAWGLNWKDGDNIVLPAGEFPSNRLPWLAQAAHGVSIREVDIRAADNAEAALIAAMDERTRVLSVSAVQWNDGLRLDLARLGAACKATDVLFFVDAIQQLGALPMDAQSWHIDFLAADAHKWLLGPEGVAVFYCSERARPALKLLQQGWHMFDNPWKFHRQEWQPAASAKRFEAGSPNTLGQTAFHASVGLLLEMGMERVSECILGNTDFLISSLQESPEIQLSSQLAAGRRSGIVSFKHARVPSKRLNGLLANAGITAAVRGDSIRISPHFYQDAADFTPLLDLLRAI
jgi:cysteine desulfurase/selenocysteine lyase